MRRARFSLSSVAGLALGLAAAGCGSSSSVTGPDEGPTAGAAVVQGSVVGASFTAAPVDGFTALSGGGGLTVHAEGTDISTTVDPDGMFILSGVPAGTVTLVFEGSGTSARLTVSGLMDGQVLSLQIHLSGGQATLTSPGHCTPTKDTKLTGVLDSKSGADLVVGGNPVDAGQVRKVRRGSQAIDLAELKLGEKVKVWGTLKGDGVLVADEIKAFNTGGNQNENKKKWITFSGKVQSVGFSALDLHASCHPTLVVAGRTVKTSTSTTFKWSDGAPLDPSEIKAGDKAYVEGWKRSNGVVDAKKVKINRR